MRRASRLMPWAIALALALVAANGARAAEGAALGNDLAGEACRFQSPLGTGTVADAILCGSGNAASGALVMAPFAAALPAAGDARRNALVAAARHMADPLAHPSVVRCDDGAPLGGTGDMLLFSCVENSTGWPRVVIVASANGAALAADGLPTMLPVLEAAVAAATGHAASPAETEAALHLVQHQFPQALEHAGGADAASYKALVELGRLDGAARDYAGAEAAYRRALEIETRIFGPTSISAGETLMELALQVSNQERFDEAAGLFRRAETIIDASADPAARARLASYRALDAANQRHFGDALKFAHAATEMRRAALGGSGGPDTDQGPASSRGELAHSLRIEAEMALRLDDTSTALAAATEVLEIINQEPGLPLWWRPDAVMLMGEINVRRENVVEAERQFRSAVAMDRTLFGDTAPTALAELRLGRFYSSQQVYDAAVQAFDPAFAILARDPVARAAVVPDQIMPYLAAAAALAAEHPNERPTLLAKAFTASQLVGSDVEGRTIARAAARLGAANGALKALLAAADDAQHQRDQFRIDIAAETAKPNDQRSAAREQALSQAFDKANAAAAAATKAIATQFPAYARFADPGPATLTDLERGLGTGEAFLTYVVGTDGTYAFLVTPDGAKLVKIDETDKHLAADVEELRRAFVPRLGAIAEFDLVASHELYRRLIEPIEGSLGGVTHLVVAPAGALASLPFALLVTAAPGGDAARHDYRDAQWLVRRMAVSQVPSARAFLALRAEAARHDEAPRPLLAIADPAFTGAATGTDGTPSKALAELGDRCRENGPMPADILRALPPLHETAEEVRAVDRVLGPGGDLLMGGGATEAAFRAQPLDQFRVLYFATHGLLPGELHCQAEPALVLSPPATPARSTDEDGLLEASEIAGLKLDADLVVLSACNTAASGSQFGGEALDGLAAAFFNAGARTVLASHWEVPSLATAKLMTDLFGTVAHEPQAGLAAALRQAQLALIADPATSHPFYWAAFSIIGDGASPDRTAAAPGVSSARGRT